MNNEQKGDSLQGHDIPSTGVEPEVKSVFIKQPQSFFGERPLSAIEMAPRVLRYQSRRDFLVFGAGALTALTAAGFLLPQETLSRIGIHQHPDAPGKEWFLNKALRIDDDIAEALYSANRNVPTYTKSQITPLKNNYNGATPDPGYIPGWKLTLDGLTSGLSISLDIRNLTTRFSVHEQTTRLIAWKAGARSHGGPVSDSTICFAPIHRCRKRNGRLWNLQSISMPQGILTLTSCRSNWRQPAIRRPCSPHT